VINQSTSTSSSSSHVVSNKVLLGLDIVTLGFVKDLRIDGGNVSFAIELTTPACPVRDQMKEDAHRAVRPLPGVERVEVRMG